MDQNEWAEQQHFEWAIRKTLEQLQIIITRATNSRDEVVMDALQEIIGNMFFVSSKCLADGKYLKINNEQTDLQ